MHTEERAAAVALRACYASSLLTLVQESLGATTYSSAISRMSAEGATRYDARVPVAAAAFVQAANGALCLTRVGPVLACDRVFLLLFRDFFSESERRFFFRNNQKPKPLSRPCYYIVIFFFFVRFVFCETVSEIRAFFLFIVFLNSTKSSC